MTAARGLLLDSTGSGNQSAIDADGNGAGKAGEVSVSAQSITLRAGSFISSEADGSGAGGDVTVTAARGLLLDSTGSDNQTAIDADGFGAGKAGEVTVSAQSITLRGGSFISSQAAGSGAGGDVTVDAKDGLLLDSTRSANQSEIDANTFGAGKAGRVTVSGREVTLRGGSFISSESDGRGAGGDVAISATLKLLLDLTGSVDQSEIDADTFGAGKAGRVMVSAGDIALRGGSKISSDAAASDSAARGNAGTVTVAASGTILIDGAGSIDGNPTAISSNTMDAGSAGSVSVGARNLELRAGGKILSDAQAGSSGNAGQVSVGADRMTIDNGLVSTGALAGFDGLPASTGNAGDVRVEVAGLLSLSGNGSGLLSGIGSNVNPGTIGDAGDVRVAAGALSIANNGEITSSTFGAGKGGRVSVAVARRLTIDAAAANPAFLTGISSQSNPGSTGDAGDVRVTSGTISLLDGGTISSAAIGATGLDPASTGNAGQVRVGARGQLSVDGPGSEIASSTGPGTIGRAGSVDVDAGALSITDNGTISGSTSGRGAGGDVAVHGRRRAADRRRGAPGGDDRHPGAHARPL